MSTNKNAKLKESLELLLEKMSDKGYPSNGYGIRDTDEEHLKEVYLTFSNEDQDSLILLVDTAGSLRYKIEAYSSKEVVEALLSC